MFINSIMTLTRNNEIFTVAALLAKLTRCLNRYFKTRRTCVGSWNVSSVIECEKYYNM